MPSARIFLIVGLGNPGKSYEKTRHNIGFMVVDELSNRSSIDIDKKKFDTCFGKGSIEGHQVILAKPLNYMNRSGPPIRRLADFFNVPIEDILIIHDDIDLAFDKLKIKSQGGHGGHNGIRSIIQSFGGNDFLRIRIGVGRPETKMDVSDFVLGKFSEDEKKMISDTIERAADAVETIISDGVVAGMNKYNK